MVTLAAHQNGLLKNVSPFHGYAKTHRPALVMPIRTPAHRITVNAYPFPQQSSDEQKIAGMKLAQRHVLNLDRVVGIDRNHDARANLGHMRLERAVVGKHRFVELKNVLHTVGVLEVGDSVLAEASSENECI